MKKLLALFIILIISALCVACGVGDPSHSESDKGPHEHEFGEWYTVKAATCLTPGLDERSCKCGEKQQRETVADSHTYVDTVVPSTCISRGYTEHKCECGSTFVDSFTDLGEHTYDNSTELTAPTYSEAGYTTHFCICGRTRVDNETPALKDDPSALPLSEACVVFPADTELTLVHSKDKLLFGISGLIGSLPQSGADKTGTYEILLGNTGRPESVALSAELSEGEFAIRTVKNKLVIVAKNDIFLHEAVDYLLDTYLSPQSNDNGPILISSSINVKKQGDVHSLYYTMMNGKGDLLFDSIPTHTVTNTKYYNPNETYETHIYRRQGGTFNGKTVYQAMISKNEELSVIVGRNLETDKTFYSSPILMGHANDVTYNPLTNRVYVCNGSSIHVFDADTLEYVETVTSAVSGSGIHFSPERNLFLFKGGLGFSTASADFSKYLESVFTSKITGYTSQGISADETFIYFLLCKGISGSKYTTHLAIYDWYGNFIRFMTITIKDNHEPENISAVDGQIYIGACTPVPTFTQFRLDLESMQLTDTNIGDIEAEEVVFDATLEAKKAFTHVNDYALDGADPVIHRRRASFFDGTYFYQAYVNVEGDLGVIAKKNVRTNEVIYSEPRDIDHARGIAYNPENNTITVSGKTKDLYVYDAETLKFIKKVSVSDAVNSISFNVKTKEYIGLTDDKVIILNSNFKVRSSYTITKPTGFQPHAMTVDENGAMHVLYLRSVGSERYTYCVGIYDYGESAYRELLAYDIPENRESPGISVVRGTIYVTGCTPVPEVTLYKLNKQ